MPSSAMVQLQGMPVEMLEPSYNLPRTRNHGVDLESHPEFRTYQTFYEMGIAPPSHGRWPTSSSTTWHSQPHSEEACGTPRQVPSRYQQGVRKAHHGC